MDEEERREGAETGAGSEEAELTLGTEAKLTLGTETELPDVFSCGLGEAVLTLESEEAALLLDFCD